MRKSLVLQKEGPYPDGEGFLFVGTEATFGEVLETLQRLSHLPNGARVDFNYQVRNSPHQAGALAFAKCSEETFSLLLAPDLKARAVRSIAPRLVLPAAFIGLVVVVLGLVSLAQYAFSFFSWLAGKV